MLEAGATAICQADTGSRISIVFWYREKGVDFPGQGEGRGGVLFTAILAGLCERMRCFGRYIRMAILHNVWMKVKLSVFVGLFVPLRLDMQGSLTNAVSSMD